MGTQLVSIVIPTYNSLSGIRRCLRSIQSQTYRPIEIVVVDKNSGDGTAEVVRENTMARIYSCEGERTTAKNFGVAQAKGTYVLFLDSDMELSDRVVEECIAQANQHTNANGIVIPEVSAGSSPWIRVISFDKSLYSNTIIESPRFFRRDFVLQAGGFDESVVFYEESTLPERIQKLGYVYMPRITATITHHHDDFSLFRWLQKKYRYGMSSNEYRFSYGTLWGLQMNLPYRVSLYIRSKKFYSSGVIAIALLLLKSLEYASIIAGALIVKRGLTSFKPPIDRCASPT